MRRVGAPASKVVIGALQVLGECQLRALGRRGLLTGQVGVDTGGAMGGSGEGVR